jgi:hypothetical protein
MLFLALGTLVPAEHVHEGDGHHAPVAHRHFDAHRAAGSHVEDSDDRVVWLSDAWLDQVRFSSSSAPAIAERVSTFAPALDAWTPGRIYDAGRPHGPPPKPGSSRAPPLPA